MTSPTPILLDGFIVENLTYIFHESCFRMQRAAADRNLISDSVFCSKVVPTAMIFTPCKRDMSSRSVLHMSCETCCWSLKLRRPVSWLKFDPRRNILTPKSFRPRWNLTVRVLGTQFSPFEPNDESRNMSWECTLSRHVSKLIITPSTKHG